MKLKQYFIPVLVAGFFIPGCGRQEGNVSYLHDLIVPGLVLPFAGSASPSGWLLCHGQAVSCTTFAGLFEIIGTTYGVGNGSTTFNVPDLRGRIAAGKDNMGGSAASRLTNAGTGNPGIDGATLGAVGGADRHTLTTAQMPAHTHNVDTAAATTFGGSSQKATIEGSTGAAPTAATQGSGQAHPNAQPTIVLNYVIKT